MNECLLQGTFCASPAWPCQLALLLMAAQMQREHKPLRSWVTTRTERLGVLFNHSFDPKTFLWDPWPLPRVWYNGIHWRSKI